MQSDCCNAPLVEETDACSKCKEHCTGATDWFEEIQAERERQIKKGWTLKHDNLHDDEFLVLNAAHYAEMSLGDNDKKYLVIAGAFIIAALERLERKDKITS